MNKILKSLVELQKVDLRLIEIEELKGGLPETVRDQEGELESFNQDMSSNDNRLNEIQSDLRTAEANIEDFSTKLNKYKDQLYLVKSNKEYDAITKEIDLMKEEISNSENKLLELEEEKSSLEDSKKLTANKIEEISVNLEKNKNFLVEAMADTKSEEEDLNNTRKSMSVKVEEKYYGSYERIRQAHDGVAVVSINRDACGTCFTQLPPQIIIEIKSNTNIINCQSCSSFLYWDEE
tara:strand:- start:3713 stop:4420 length:708 start_codon:yes stop_codon:yes gene_type:complete